MFNHLSRFLLLFSLLLCLPAQALTVEAEGRAIIVGDDIVAAREAAIKDASQQASMQAAVYVSSNQVVRDGILEIDNMQIRTLGKVSQIKLLDEQVIGNILQVRIRAEVNTEQGCSNGEGNAYRKSVAITGFPFLIPTQANHGGLSDMPDGLASQLGAALNAERKLHALNASQITLHPEPARAGNRQLDDGRLTSLQTNLNLLQVNFVVSGVIRDLSMADPRTLNEDNYFFDLYNRLDYRSKKHLRTFVIDLYIHDGFSGAQLWQKQYRTAGLWNLDPTTKTGFSGSGFQQQDYGRKVRALQKTIATEVSQFIQCQPFKARILQTEGNNLLLSAGNDAGLQAGDRLTVYRQETLYTAGQSIPRLTNTHQTVTIQQIQAASASGTLSEDSRQLNIRSGDLVIAE